MPIKPEELAALPSWQPDELADEKIRVLNEFARLLEEKKNTEASDVPTSTKVEKLNDIERLLAIVVGDMVSLPPIYFDPSRHVRSENNIEAKPVVVNEIRSLLLERARQIKEGGGSGYLSEELLAIKDADPHYWQQQIVAWAEQFPENKELIALVESV